MAPDRNVKEIPIADISANPFQPRKNFDNDSIDELADSIKSVGVMQPIVVRKVKDGYQIACGERRWRAAKKAGVKAIEAVVKELDDRDMMMYSLVENLHRKDLESEEREKAVHELWKNVFEPGGESMSDMCRALGMGKDFVTQNVSAYERRNKLDLTGTEVSTKDFHQVSVLDDKTAEQVLKAKARGDLRGKEVERIVPVLKETKPERREAVVDKVVKEHRAAEKFKDDVREEARAFGSGEVESTGVKVVKSADIKRVEKFKELHDTLLWWRLATIEAVDNDGQRNEVVGFIEAIRDHCDGLVAQAAKRDWYAPSKK